MFKYFSDFYPQVLNSLKSNTFLDVDDSTIENVLDMFAERAISEFKYPRVSLEYIRTPIGLQFTGVEVSQNEINVIMAQMKCYWLEQQMDNEDNFGMEFYDKDIKVFSKGNIVGKLKERLEMAKRDAKMAQKNYSKKPKSTDSGRTAFSGIYDE